MDLGTRRFLFPTSMYAVNDRVNQPILVAADEAWTSNHDDHQFAFMAYVWRRGEEHYHLRHFERNTSPDTLFERALLIPHEHYMPYPSSDLAVTPEALEDSDMIFHKQPALVDFAPDSPSNRTANNVLHEAQIYQIIMRHPHPNLCQYFGYIPSKDGRIASLCLKRYPKDLKTTMKEDKVDIPHIISGVNRGLEHLHSLGLVHNDINVYNVVMDESGNAVIIDFDSCWPVGESLKGKKVGADSDISSLENDRIAVEQLRTRLGEMAKARAYTIQDRRFIPML